MMDKGTSFIFFNDCVTDLSIASQYLLLPILVFALYCIHVSTTDSLANKFSRALGDTPSMWDSVYDAQRNGPLVAFTRQLNPKIMDTPSNYSEETMKKDAARY